MSVFLLILGALTTAAGSALLASGVTTQDGIFNINFNIEVVTPGTIAAVGGLLLIGIGLAVRQLRRIEKVLATRAVPHAVRPSDAIASATPQPHDRSSRNPLPPRLAADSNLQVAAAATHADPATTTDAVLEPLRAKFPILARAEQGPVVDGSNVSLMPRPQSGAEEESRDLTDAAAFLRGGNGGARARSAPRLDAKARFSAVPNRKGPALNALWPAASRGYAGTAPAEGAAQTPPPLPAALANEKPGDAGAAVDAAAAIAPVSVLKSGVVEGMAYTFYSDGSIEAHLPQGTLRFGSIGALRNHIESSA